MKNSNNLLLIFTRNPELGKVKSRLAKDVGAEAALEIYKFLLNHTKTITQNLEGVDKQVWYSENITEKDIWDANFFDKKEQLNHPDLGRRMLHAFLEGFKKGYQNIIIIGSDLYDIQTEDIQNAFKKLEKNDAIIGPATDGGFYLLGLKKVIPAIFENKEWGTASVLKHTLTDLTNYNYTKLQAKNDVDYLSDIKDISIFSPFLKHLNLSPQ